MANLKLINAIRLHDDLINCPCIVPKDCIACTARSEQLSAFAVEFIIEQLGNVDELPQRLCQFNNFVTHIHTISHIGEVP